MADECLVSLLLKLLGYFFDRREKLISKITCYLIDPTCQNVETPYMTLNKFFFFYIYIYPTSQNRKLKAQQIMLLLCQTKPNVDKYTGCGHKELCHYSVFLCLYIQSLFCSTIVFVTILLN